MKNSQINRALIALMVVFILGGVFISQVGASPEALFEGLAIAPDYKPIGMHNPIISHRFGADPYALVYEDRVYVFATNDAIVRDGSGNIVDINYGLIRSLNLFSSADLVNWTDHGSINIGPPFRGLATWASNSWAPAAIHKNIEGADQFFLYFANNASGIGVLTSDSPVGPYIDPIGEPLVSRDVPNANVEWLFDPAVVIDNDGTGYLYFGGGVPQGMDEYPNTGRVVELNDDMISLAGTPEMVEAPWFFEAAFVHKMDDTFYFSYSTNFGNRSRATGDIMTEPGEIVYMTSQNPMGPWEYQGSILKNPSYFFDSGGNNHHSIIEFHDEWYIFYHTQVLQDNMGARGGYRSTHVDKVNVDASGAITPITATRTGVEQIKSLNPYQINEAETMAWAGNIGVKSVNESSANFGEVNMVVTDMQSGSFIGLSDVDFGNGPSKFIAKVASEKTGNVIKITTGNPKNDALGFLEVPNTGNLNQFEEVTVDLDGTVTGVHDLFFVFVGEGFDFDAWYFQN